MVLTSDFEQAVLARVQRYPRFRSALQKEGIGALLAGDVDTGEALLRDYLAPRRLDLAYADTTKHCYTCARPMAQPRAAIGLA
jgi:hypothetical protein